MTCRVARSFHDYTHLDLTCCCQCGSANSETWGAFNTLGPHLCPFCAQSRVESGAAKEWGPKPVRDGVSC